MAHVTAHALLLQGQGSFDRRRDSYKERDRDYDYKDRDYKGGRYDKPPGPQSQGYRVVISGLPETYTWRCAAFMRWLGPASTPGGRLRDRS
jgi:hypothetical protein